MNKKTRRLAVLVVALVVVALIGLTTQWRFRAVTMKLGGQLTELSWGQIFSFFGDYLDPGGARDTGFVTLGREEGTAPCSFYWVTPVGSVWGRSGQEPTLEYLMREQLVDKIYDHDKAGVRPGDVVIDVGGHLGTFTRFAFSKGAERVIVIEPEVQNLACLKRTFPDEIRRGAVTLVEAAAWREAGVLRFSGEDGTGQVDDQGEVSVRAVTIDETVAALGLERVDFIKMDIEGAEPDALIGARETLSRHGPRMVLSTYHEPEHPREIRELVLAARPRYRLDETGKFSYFY